MINSYINLELLYMDKDKLRINITKFIQWNNRNGYNTDEECDLEEEQRMTYEETVKYANK